MPKLFKIICSILICLIACYVGVILIYSDQFIMSAAGVIVIVISIGRIIYVIKNRNNDF